MKKEQSYLVEVPNTLLAFMLQTIKGQSRNTIKHLLSRGQVLRSEERRVGKECM